MTMHDDVDDKLSDYLDDELTAEGRQLVDAHLAGCPACARTLEELRRIVATAAALPPREPDADLWGGIAEKIAAGRRAGVKPVRRFAFTLPQLAAASVLLAVLSGWFALRITRQADRQPRDAPAGSQAREGAPASVSSGAQALPASLEDAQYDAAVGDLEQTLEAGRGRLDAETIAAVQQDLKIIDAALADARKALAADPANDYLSGYIAQTRQRKLALLRQAAALAM